MYGMMEGLTAGVGLGRQARQDAWSMEEAAANRRMREEQLAMQKAQHALTMQMQGLQLGREQQIADLTNQLTTGLAAPANNAKTFAAQDDDFAKADALAQQGLPVPKADEALWGPSAIQKGLTERQQNDLTGRIALLNRDMAGFAAARSATKKLDVDDTFKANMQKLATDPKYRDTLRSHLNTNGVIPLTMLDPEYDKAGNLTKPTRVSVVGKDGKAKEIQLSEADMTQFALGAAYMENGLTEQGLQIIRGVNKEVADAIDRGNKTLNDSARTSIQGENVQSDARYRMAGLANDMARTQAQIAASNRTGRGNVIELVDEKGNSRLFERNELPVGKNGELMIPPGLKPKTARPDVVSQKDMADLAIKIYNESGGKLTPQGAMMQAQAMFGAYDPMAAVRQNLGLTGAPSDGMPSIQAPTPTNRILSKSEQESIGAARTDLPPVPSRLIREAKRGGLGGVSYVYRDPVTNRTYSLEQYNAALGGN